MELVARGQAFSFNYTVFSQNAALNVAFGVYDITTGTPAFVQQVIGSLADFGAYTGTFTPDGFKSYLVVGTVFTDNTYTTVDLNYAPTSATFQVVSSSPATFFPFTYAAYDQDPALSVQASVFDLSTGTPVFLTTVEMAYLIDGVYYGVYTGVLGSTYQIASVVYTDDTFTDIDPNRVPACDGFDSIQGGTITNTYFAATLIGQNGVVTKGVMLTFTQGDTALMTLIATNGQGEPFNITGATFETQIKGPNGQIAVFPNGQHTITDAESGQFSLELSTDDTAKCGLGMHKEIITKISQSGSVIYFRGTNILTVYPPEPQQ